jgi:hypothetical protein
MPTTETIRGFIRSALPDILISAVSFLISALIYGIARFRQYWIHRRPFYQIWGLKQDVKEVNIVTGTIYYKPEIKIPSMSRGDIVALTDIVSSLRLFYANTRFRHYFSAEFPPQGLSSPIVSIGGPRWNRVTRLLLESRDSPFVFDEFCLVDRETSDRYSATIQEDRIVRDYGLIVKISNPYNRDEIALVIAGCHTFGCHAAARVVSAVDEHSKRALKEFSRTLKGAKYFGAVVEAEVVDEHVASVRIVSYKEVNSRSWRYRFRNWLRSLFKRP